MTHWWVIVAGEFCLICGVLALWAWREYQHDQERRDLYNRLMARDYTEYANAGRPPPGKVRNFIRRGLQMQAEEEGD